VTRWALVTLGTFIVLGAAGVAVARFFGKSGSRLSIQVAVVSQWLAAYVLWSFVVALAMKYRALGSYEAWWFVPFALAIGWWHYRVRLSAGRERALSIFVGAQLVWLSVVLLQAGLLMP
jgi:hypothetical protein